MVPAELVSVSGRPKASRRKRTDEVTTSSSSPGPRRVEPFAVGELRTGVDRLHPAGFVEDRLGDADVVLTGLGEDFDDSFGLAEAGEVGAYVGQDQRTHYIVFEYIEGVIPVLATKADRFEGEDNRNNKIIRQAAYDYRVPLWDFDLLAGTLPGRGMGADDVHLTFFDYYDYNLEA